MKEILVLGGGAAGLSAALSAADRDPAARILLLEGLDRVGKKLLATGNGKCNLTNRAMGPEYYHTSAPDRLAQWLDRMPTEATVDFFQTLGLRCMEDEAGRLYPYSRQAAMVADLLRLGLERRPGIEVRCGAKVTGLRREGKGFAVSLQSGETITAGQVILTTGGRAAAKQGSDGSGFALARSLGHTCTPLMPGLVSLRCQGRWFKTLKGLRVLCTASLMEGKRRVAVQQGEVQFTDYGLSGIPILQLSCLLRGEQEIMLDFVPETPYSQLLEAFLYRRRQYGSEALENALLGLLPRRLQYVLMREAELDPEAPASQASRRALETLAGRYKQWRVGVAGTQGWEQAQTTVGGIPLSEVGEDFSSRKAPGLFLAGEILDVAGDCGGYNLHWAWNSGRMAGMAAAEANRRRRSDAK